MLNEVSFLGRSKGARTDLLKAVFESSSLPILSWKTYESGVSSIATLLDGKPLSLHFLLKIGNSKR